MRAFGTYNIKVSHPEQLLKQLISTDGLFQVDEISDQLRNTIVSAFANWVGNSRVPLLRLCSQLHADGRTGASCHRAKYPAVRVRVNSDIN